jgi:hypothetical protein
MRDNPAVLSAVLLIPLATWAALGPLLGTDGSRQWNFNYFVLSILPAAAVVLGGLMMLSRRQRPARFGGLLALAGGLWFVVGPATYVLWAGIGTGPALGGSVWMAQWAPFFVGAGAAITLLSSYALGFVAPLTFSDDAFEPPRPARAHERLDRQHARRHRPPRPAPQRARLHSRR